MYPEDIATGYATIQRLISGETDRVEMEKRYVHKSGHVIWTRVSGTIARDDANDAYYLICHVRDITDRKRAEELVRIRVHLLESTASQSAEELLQTALAEAGALTESPVGFYLLNENGNERFSLQAWWSSSISNQSCSIQVPPLHYNIDFAGAWADGIRKRQPLIHNDFASAPNRKGFPEGHVPITRELVVPVLRDSRVVGVLAVGNKATEYTQEDVEAASYVANPAWEINLRKRAETALEES